MDFGPSQRYTGAHVLHRPLCGSGCAQDAVAKELQCLGSPTLRPTGGFRLGTQYHLQRPTVGRWGGAPLGLQVRTEPTPLRCSERYLREVL